MSLKFEAVSKRNRSGWPLRDVSFKARPGEVFGIFDSNAVSRSTLTRLVAGEERPTGGRLTFGSDGSMGPPRYGSVGLVGSASRNGFLGRIRSALGAAEPEAGDPLAELRRVAGSKVGLIVISDSLSGLGEPHKLAARELVSAAASGRVVVIVSGSFEEILWYCDSAAIIHRGEVLQTGSPEELYMRPATSAVAAHTGRCNIFNARRLSSSKAEIPEFQTLEGEHRLTAGKPEKVRLGSLNRDIKLAIRPEHISLSFGASFPEDNLLKAAVVNSRFLGPNTLVLLDAGGLQIEASVMRLVGLQPGDECMLGLPPDRVMIFPE